MENPAAGACSIAGPSAGLRNGVDISFLAERRIVLASSLSILLSILCNVYCWLCCDGIVEGGTCTRDRSSCRFWNVGILYARKGKWNFRWFSIIDNWNKRVVFVDYSDVQIWNFIVWKITNVKKNKILKINMRIEMISLWNLFRNGIFSFFFSFKEVGCSTPSNVNFYWLLRIRLFYPRNSINRRERVYCDCR